MGRRKERCERRRRKSGTSATGVKEKQIKEGGNQRKRQKKRKGKREGYCMEGLGEGEGGGGTQGRIHEGS